MTHGLRQAGGEAQVASYLRDLGPPFDARNAADRAELALAWMHGFNDPDTCEEWIDAGFWCPFKALSVSDLGIEPFELAILRFTWTQGHSTFPRFPQIADLLPKLTTDPVSALCTGELPWELLDDYDPAIDPADY